MCSDRKLTNFNAGRYDSAEPRYNADGTFRGLLEPVK
jgi:hypothetical protein